MKIAAIIFLLATVSIAGFAQKPTDQADIDAARAGRGGRYWLEADAILLKPNQLTRLVIKQSLPPAFDNYGNPQGLPKIVIMPGVDPNYSKENWRIIEGGGQFMPVADTTVVRHYRAPASVTGSGLVKVGVDLIPKKQGLPKISLYCDLVVKPMNKWTGNVKVSVDYLGVDTTEILKSSDEANRDSGKATSTLHTFYDATERITLSKHDGFVSALEPRDQAISGAFTFERVATRKQDMNFNNADIRETIDTDETSRIAGKIGSIGNISVEFADGGDAIVSIGTSAAGTGTAKRSETVKSSRHGTNTDTECLALLGLPSINVIDKTCRSEMNLAFNVRVRPFSPDEAPMMETGDNWAGAQASGSFDSGKYTVTFTGTRKPSAMQTNDGITKHSFSETVTITLTIELEARADK